MSESDCLSVRDGRLFVEDCDATELAERFGTPLFVLSEAQLRANARRFQAAFTAAWSVGPVELLPAFKANWTLASRRVLTEEGCGADVYSPGELHGVLAAGVDPEKVSVNGGGKSEALLARCIEAGVRITIEDIDEPELIQKVARALGKKAKVRFRVKLDLPELWRRTDFAAEHASIDLGVQVYKSGIPGEYLEELGRRVLGMPELELTGLHTHLGRHHAGLWFWKTAMKGYARTIARLCKAWGYQPKEIDIGGGFASPRDPHNKLGVREDVTLSALTYPFEQVLRLFGPRARYAMLSRLLKVFGKAPSDKRAPSIEAYAQASAGTLRDELVALGMSLDGVRLQLEPGRSLYGDTGIHLTRIKKVKRQTRPMRMTWVLTDTTYFFLAGGTFEMNLHDFRVANKAEAPAVELADIVGHSCYADRLLPFVRVPAVEPGDVVALLDTGAYQESSASNFNALPRPATVLVCGKAAEVIRRAETEDEVYARDRVPERLRAGPGHAAAEERQVASREPLAEARVAQVQLASSPASSERARPERR